MSSRDRFWQAVISFHETSLRSVAKKARARIRASVGRWRPTDAGVAPYKSDYNPSLSHRIWLRLRYTLLSRGIPLTRNDARIASFKNRYRGQTAVLVGNGPSLLATDLSLIQQYPTFGSNAAYELADLHGFYLDHLFVEDKFVAEDRASDINGLTETTVWFGNYLTYVLDASPSHLCANVLMDYDVRRNNWPRFSYNAGRKLWTGGTVSYLLMQLAYFMGVETLVLVGFDNSYKIPHSNGTRGNDILSSEADKNHFSTEYFGPGKRWHDPMSARMERAYSRAQEAWLNNGRILLNASSGGKLDVFVRLPLKESLKLSGGVRDRLIALAKARARFRF